jgi:hypothetical protein
MNLLCRGVSRSAPPGRRLPDLGLYRWEQNWVFEEIQVFGEWGFCWGRDSATLTWAVARGINNMTRHTA